MARAHPHELAEVEKEEKKEKLQGNFTYYFLKQKSHYVSGSFATQKLFLH